jgi:epoxide hydrolase-like predicted phosphatase
MLKAIIFDCFGVLYPVYIDDWFTRNKARLTLDRATLDKLNLQIDLGRISQQELYEAFSREVKLPVEVIQEEIEQNITLDANLVDLIKKLKSRYKLGLLSNAGEEEISIIYKDKVADIFDSITVSYEAKCVKPDPGIFQIAAKRLNVAPNECLFIDDSHKNIEAAQNLGMKTITYPGYSKIPEELFEIATF